jgi:hypothetical protein
MGSAGKNLPAIPEEKPIHLMPRGRGAQKRTLLLLSCVTSEASYLLAPGLKFADDPLELAHRDRETTTESFRFSERANIAGNLVGQLQPPRN